MTYNMRFYDGSSPNHEKKKSEQKKKTCFKWKRAENFYYGYPTKFGAQLKILKKLSEHKSMNQIENFPKKNICLIPQ
jgi:hypothetical protein